MAILDVKPSFAAAAVLAGMLVMGQSKAEMPRSPYDEPPPPPPPTPETGFSVTPIQKGDFFTLLNDGAYRLDISAQPFGGKPGTKVPCLLIKERDGHGLAAAISCDWSKLQPADGPK